VGGYQYEKGKERGERQRKVERGDCISLKKDKNKQTNSSFKLFFCSPFEGQ
jgi:ribosomal protein S6E (S10)